MCDPVAPLSAKGNIFLDQKFGYPANAASSAASPSPSVARPDSLPISIGKAAPGEGDALYSAGIRVTECTTRFQVPSCLTHTSVVASWETKVRVWPALSFFPVTSPRYVTIATFPSP